MTEFFKKASMCCLCNTPNHNNTECKEFKKWILTNIKQKKVSEAIISYKIDLTAKCTNRQTKQNKKPNLLIKGALTRKV